MESLRETAEQDLYDCIESELGTVIELTSPDGATQKYSANNPTELLRGSIRMYSRGENPETGEPIVVDKPSVTLRTSSLTRVPAPNEKWFIRFATSPVHGAPMKQFLFSIDRAYEKGTDLGIIKIMPQTIENDTVIPTGSES